MKKRRISLVLKCLIVIFVIYGFGTAFTRYHTYNEKKRIFVDSKKADAKFAVDAVRRRMNRIVYNINTVVNELTVIFNAFNPSRKDKTEILKTFGGHSLIYGIGYIELPGKNAYTEYIYLDDNKIHYANIRKIMPDYYTHTWFINPEKTKKPYTETPTINKIGNKKMYMITYSYPHIDKDGKFRGVFVFDLFLKELTDDLNEYIKYNNIDVSMFFPEEKESQKIKFIRNTDISLLSKQKQLKLLIKLINKNNGTYHFDKVDAKDGIVGIAISVFDGKAYVMVTFNKNIIISGLKNILYRELFFLIMMLFIAFILLYIVLRYSFKPIEKISRNVIRISKGEFDANISVKSSAIEIIRLNEAIRKMQIQLKHYVAKMKKSAELNTELKIAADIQKSVIPKPVSTIKRYPNIDVFQLLKPAKEASGDFYDYYMLNDENLFLSIGDVTGKGVPASLFTVMMISMEKMYKSIHISMPETLKLVNKEIIKMNDLNIFISYFCMVVNLKTGKARYANAGHDSPLISKKDGSTISLKQGKGTFLGIFENIEYSEEHYQFEDGDSLLMYTDGITEAMNDKSELFGKERTKNTLSLNYDKNAENIVNSIINEINDFTENTPQSDDICAVCLKYFTPKP